MYKVFCLLLSLILLSEPVVVYARSTMLMPLPLAGEMLSLSKPYAPPLLKGMHIDPSYPLQFEFIFDLGEEALSDEKMHDEAQRMIHYFFAALTIPQQDLWVNLSPIEKDRIIPDRLIQTELGRDLLAQDYVLKQLSASLIYPEKGLGKDFWQRVYHEVYEKFGVVDLSIETLNKIWILPQRAEVFEKDQTIYITKTYLKVMLETDYQAMGHVSLQQEDPQQELTKQILREVILPAIEKEVNEGKHFAPLRQIFHAIVLAQWYRDVFKGSMLNKFYSEQNKVVGIDVADHQDRQKIYQQYLQAYEQGVFNYIKEERDNFSQENIPVKYFSGGISVPEIPRELGEPIEDSERQKKVTVQVDPVRKEDSSMKIESSDEWLSLERPRGLLKELQEIWYQEEFDSQKAEEFFKKYSLQVDAEVRLGNPVQGIWPVLKAIIMLGRDRERILVDWIKQKYSTGTLTRLMMAVLLMNGAYDDQWVATNAIHLKQRPYYFLSMEIDFKAGGLGPVNVTHTKYMKDLGANVIAVQPLYSTRFDTGKIGGEKLDYIHDMGIKDFKRADQGTFQIQLGQEWVNVEVFEGINKEGVKTYLIGDVQPDGSSKYTKTLYRYQTKENPVSKEKTMAFFNVAAAKWLNYLETKRKDDLKSQYQLPVIHPQDGQMSPFIAVIKSQYPLLKEAITLGTTHTILNVGANGVDAIDWFLKQMLQITTEYISAFRTKRFFDANVGDSTEAEGEYIHHTKGMLELAHIPTGVSWSHAKDMSRFYERTLQAITNGDDPYRISSFFRESVKSLFPNEKDFDYLPPRSVMLAKELSAQKFNALRILTANGEILLSEAQKIFGNNRSTPITDLKDLTDNEADVLIRHARHVLNMTILSRDQIRHGFVVTLDPKNMTIGYARRLVWEKNNFDASLIKELVQLGFNVVFMGNHQGQASEELAIKYRSIENEINEMRDKALMQGLKDVLPGKFFFVQHFTEEQKIAFLGATNVYFMANKEHLGAHEVTEENPGPNYAYQFALPHRDGGSTDWLLPVDFLKPGSGSLLMPRPGTSYLEWIKEIFIPLKELWLRGEPFYANAVLSAQMNRIQQGQLTSSAYLLAANDFIEKQKIQQQEDQRAVEQLMKYLHNKTLIKEQILFSGPEGITPFYFRANDVAMIPQQAGLKEFLKTIKDAESLHGYNALFEDTKYYGQFLLGLFKAAPEAQHVLSAWLQRWHKMSDDVVRPKDVMMEKNERIKRFLQAVVERLEKDISQTQEIQDTSEQITTGGIDARHIYIDRFGEWRPSMMSEESLESLFVSCEGIKAVITSVTPIESIRSLLKL